MWALGTGRAARLLGLGLAVAVLLVGCGGTDTTGPPAQGQQEIDRLIADEATEAQRPYLEDGVVTAAEREAAFLSYVSCLEDSGIEVKDYFLKPRGGETLSMSSDVLDNATVEEVNDDCREQHYRVTAIVFSTQNAPTAQEEAQWLLEVIECLRKRGFDVPDGATRDDLIDIAPLESSECYDAAEGIVRPGFEVTP